jgi:hypothetical protein
MIESSNHVRMRVCLAVLIACSFLTSLDATAASRTKAMRRRTAYGSGGRRGDPNAQGRSYNLLHNSGIHQTLSHGRGAFSRSGFRDSAFKADHIGFTRRNPFKMSGMFQTRGVGAHIGLHSHSFTARDENEKVGAQRARQSRLAQAGVKDGKKSGKSLNEARRADFGTDSFAAGSLGGFASGGFAASPFALLGGKSTKPEQPMFGQSTMFAGRSKRDQIGGASGDQQADNRSTSKSDRYRSRSSRFGAENDRFESHSAFGPRPDRFSFRNRYERENGKSPYQSGYGSRSANSGFGAQQPDSDE